MTFSTPTNEGTVMIQNMGSTDRYLRGNVAVGLVVIAALVGFRSAGGITALVLVAILGGTAAVGTCPAYLPFGIDTRPKNSSH
jgi:hypothetical protein